MANINEQTRAEFTLKQQPYKDAIDASLNKEKSIVEIMKKDTTGVSYKKLLLAEEMIYVATLYITINNISVKILDTKNNDALNEARKSIYKAIIYMEDIVSNVVDCPYSELTDKLETISNTPIEKRYFLVRKIGLAISLLMDAYGENTKWKWSFVEMQGRLAVIAKNLIDMKKAAVDYFDPRSPDYDNTVLYVRLIRTLIDKSSMGYRDKYELSTHRIDDMRIAINYLLASRKIALVMGDKDIAEDIKKKAIVWKDKLDADQKSGTAN
ncbi:MAG: hypothetical protein WCQ67_03400 [Treponema sp.]